MPGRKPSAVQETRKLLALHHVQTPSYFPLSAMTEMQKHVGYKPNSNAKPHRQPLSFTSTEQPRNIQAGAEVSTPSWFRYANIDGPSHSYASMPSGYQWDVEYYRREDGTLMTNPALAKIPSTNPQPRKKARLNDFARSMTVKKEELTDEGIEDISSDEELYTKDEHTAELDNDEDGDVSVAARFPGTAPPVHRSGSSRSSVSVLSQFLEAPLVSVFSTQSASIMAPLMASSSHSYGLSPSAQDKRIDSRHQSMFTNTSTDREEEVEVEDVLHSIEGVDGDEQQDSESGTVDDSADGPEGEEVDEDGDGDDDVEEE